MRRTLPFSIFALTLFPIIHSKPVDFIDIIPIDQRASDPIVTIPNGTLIGTTDDGVDTWNGIPFAKPPTGSLRLKPPQPLDQPLGTFKSVDSQPLCPQFIFSTGNNTGPAADALAEFLNTALPQAALHETEDCLTLNVQRPAGTASNAKLPVLLWIFGGGFELGGTNLPPIYDATTMIQKSVSLGQPIVWVAISYRVAGFGFLPGKELMQDGSTNLGLRDQRLAMEWVQDNIAAFGGQLIPK